MKLPNWATTVTPLSKTLALIIFITFPLLGFKFGMEYQKAYTLSQENNTNIQLLPIVPSTSEALYPTKPPVRVGMPNPAAVYCEEQGGKNKIITAPDGSQAGLCVFSDGRSCDDWEFFRTKVCK